MVRALQRLCREAGAQESPGSTPPEELHYEIIRRLAETQRQCMRRSDDGIWLWTTDTRANGHPTEPRHAGAYGRGVRLCHDQCERPHHHPEDYRLHIPLQRE